MAAALAAARLAAAPVGQGGGATQGVVLTVAAAGVLPGRLAAAALVVALLLLAESFGLRGPPAGGLRRGDSRGPGQRDRHQVAYSKVSLIPRDIHDERAFAKAATDDPLRHVPRDRLLTGLRGKDVIVGLARLGLPLQPTARS
ncbi:MAG: hypothetical protein ACXVEU_10745 [Nocardioidaceae bacterium]